MRGIAKAESAQLWWTSRRYPAEDYDSAAFDQAEYSGAAPIYADTVRRDRSGRETAQLCDKADGSVWRDRGRAAEAAGPIAAFSS
jgi:hypothetical protein